MVSFNHTAEDYDKHRADFPPRLFAKLRDDYGIGPAGQLICDLGTGTGALARGFDAATVVGTDIAHALMRAGRKRAAHVAYVRARAEDIPLADGLFDVVTAGQCWHWFDRAAATNEVWRLLKPGGRVVIAHFDWLEHTGSVAAMSAALIRAHNPSWQPGAHYLQGEKQGLYPAWLADLARFQAVETFSFVEDVAYTHEAWRGRIRASAGVATMADVPAFDTALAQQLAEQFPQNPLTVPHRTWAVVAAKPR